jgi:hypothetical protein
MSETIGPALGKISGKLLKDNLLRDGRDLSFRNNPTDLDLLFLDVNNMRIGINTDSPSYDLDVSGTTNIFGNFNVAGTSVTVDQLSLNANGIISSLVGNINISPTGPDAYVFYEKVLNDNLVIDDNFFEVTSLNQNLILDPNGSGIVDFLSSSRVNGDLNVTQNITSTGNISLNGTFTIGDSPVDTIVISPDFAQSIVPGDTLLYNLGSNLKKWDNAFIRDVNNVENFNTTSLIVSDQIRITGNTISSLQSNDAIILSAENDKVWLEDIEISNNVIENLNSTPITFSSNGRGYYKITDTNAMAVPFGAYGLGPARPGIAVGETRWNTDHSYLECFDGNIWQVATGGGMVVTAPIMEELGHVYSLIFG